MNLNNLRLHLSLSFFYAPCNTMICSSIVVVVVCSSDLDFIEVIATSNVFLFQLQSLHYYWSRAVGILWPILNFYFCTLVL